MKIQAISTNTNFKGLFTDKTAQNGGNWKMEYQPYSWEKNKNDEIGKMANKARFDIYDSKLPDNEEIFTELEPSYKERSADILGTNSYYKTYDNRMRRTITELPAMNREESLKVVDRKLDKFLMNKHVLRRQLEYDFDKYNNGVLTASSDYDSWSKEHEKGIFERSYNKSESRYYMDQKKSDLLTNSEKMYDNSQKYIRLMGSIDAVREAKENGRKEIEKLQELRKADKLIDISSRTVDNPNAPLEAALQNIKAAAEKYICLPNKLLSMKEVLKMVNPRYIEGGYNKEIIQHVENLIKITV